MTATEFLSMLTHYADGFREYAIQQDLPADFALSDWWEQFELYMAAELNIKEEER